MKRIGWRNKVYGDESTNLIAVTELDQDEQLSNTLITRYKEQLKTIMEKTYGPKGVKLLPSEKGKVSELEALIEALEENCRHRVFRDEAGFLYDLRYCITCGAFMGSG